MGAFTGIMGLPARSQRHPEARAACAARVDADRRGGVKPGVKLLYLFILDCSAPSFYSRISCPIKYNPLPSRRAENFLAESTSSFILALVPVSPPLARPTLYAGLFVTVPDRLTKEGPEQFLS